MSIFQFFQPHFPAKIPSIFPPSKPPSHFSADFLNALRAPGEVVLQDVSGSNFALGKRWELMIYSLVCQLQPHIVRSREISPRQRLVRLPAATTVAVGSSPHGLSSQRPLLGIVRIHIKSKFNRPNFGVHFLVQFIARENRCSAQYSHDLLAR